MKRFHLIASWLKTSPYKNFLYFSALFSILIVSFHFGIAVDIEGDFEGIYLLKGLESRPLEIRDSIYLGEIDRLFFQLEVPWLHTVMTHNAVVGHQSEAHLSYKWNARGGHGYVHSTRPDGTEFLICLSRFLDSTGRMPKGIFVGGEIPRHLYGEKGVHLNETGVAYKNQGRWNHIWCNANEGIAAGADAVRMIYPSEWKYLGSEVLFSSSSEIAIKSRHSTVVDAMPMQIERFFNYRARDNYFTLGIKFRNDGYKPLQYYYVYGDEPWLGNYGSSAGNVGWTDGKLYQYAGMVDSIRHNIAGMVDIGNTKLPSENGKQFSGLANFMAWYGLLRPQVVYFSNKEGVVNDESENVLLDSPTNRVLFAQWAPPALQPGQSTVIVMAIGMVDPGKSYPIPTPPQIEIPWETLNKVFDIQ